MNTKIKKSRLLKGLLILVLFSSIPVFAQDSGNLTDSNNTTNITDTVETVTPPSPKTDWNIGIFAIIGSAITFIGILLTIRFVYIDKIHEERIRKILDDREKVLEEQEQLVSLGQFKTDNIRWFAEYISSFYVAIENVSERRKANNRTGILVDIFCMFALFVVGAFATTGFFEASFILLLITVGIIAFFPVTHFIIQLKKTQYQFQFNH